MGVELWVNQNPNVQSNLNLCLIPHPIITITSRIFIFFSLFLIFGFALNILSLSLKCSYGVGMANVCHQLKWLMLEESIETNIVAYS